MRNVSLRSMALAGLMPLLLAACATNSQPTPPVVVEPVKLTPLPASVREIDSRSSEAYLQKASSWRQKVERLFSDETPK
ncbi:MAG: hypothetical protein K0Q92_659 [Steroidobacteraceae bacterium]|nr:hypothetical protein [Steroidobacteraceae bacterium]